MHIYKNTVSDLLWSTLSSLMDFEDLQNFRLVGGTSLSLLLGHRMSVDIDLFTDAPYDSIDFEKIDQLFLNTFGYVEMGSGGNNSMGKTYFVGHNSNETIKIDLFYTDVFVFPILQYQNVRLSQFEEIAAMKLEVVGNGGRKKDFWDLHELLELFNFDEMLDFYGKRYPYNYTRQEIINQLINFDEAEDDLNPICLKDKYWELIKLDIEEQVQLLD